MSWSTIPKQPLRTRALRCRARGTAGRGSGRAPSPRSAGGRHLCLERLELVLELLQLASTCHQAHELLPVDLRLLERAEALATVQDHEAVADRISMVGVV